MCKVGRISRFFTIAFVTLTIVTQAMFIGTAVFAEDREKQDSTETIIKTAETAEQKYKMNLDHIAEKYHVEADYLYYIAEVEKSFNLEPYELVALIAQESGFVSQTKMDGGSLSYNTTQMKLPTAKTAYMAITEYYKKDIPYPSHDLLANDKYYAAMLAGGYLKYLQDTYNDKYESYTAYRYGIGGRLGYFQKYGSFKSRYALALEDLSTSFAQEESKI